ncbi:unnamed protein product [Ilex paraguariensis]|uniref:Exostosin GT47 domain-containing protein n=1 Tax=Ilex paraguariensis TaxID=185542 RepID=A0ABC8TDM7_9AQUA
MEKLINIYVYEKGEPPMFHNGPCRSIYSTEGGFINEMEKGNFYRTKDPDQALVYILPFSVVMMVQYIYVPGDHDIHPIGHTVADYIDIISKNHPFWNRTLGADHFMLSCHDWSFMQCQFLRRLQSFERCFITRNSSQNKGNHRTYWWSIAFRTINSSLFVGRLHDHIRYLLLKQWKGKDQDVQVFESLLDGLSYNSMLKKSRFCLCPSGYEVASPRVVEAIYAECIPVLISDGYVPPFSDVLNWKAFSIVVPVKDIHNIKKILMSISQT